MLFIGDSTVRQLYYATAKMLDKGVGALPASFEDGEKHSDKKVALTSKTSDYNVAQSSVELEFWW